MLVPNIFPACVLVNEPVLWISNIVIDMEMEIHVNKLRPAGVKGGEYRYHHSFWGICKSPGDLMILHM